MHTLHYSIKFSYIQYMCAHAPYCPFPTATVFLEYLQGSDTAEEIQGMIMTLFEEETSKAREFAGKFIENRQKMIDVSTVHTVHGYRVQCTISTCVCVCTSYLYSTTHCPSFLMPQGVRMTESTTTHRPSSHSKQSQGGRSHPPRGLTSTSGGGGVKSGNNKKTAAEKPNIGEIQSVNDVHK